MAIHSRDIIYRFRDKSKCFKSSLCLLIIMAITTLHTRDSELMAQVLLPQKVNISYFGQTITHPGLKAGLEYTLKSKNFIRNKRNGTQVPKKYELILTSNLGFFYQKRFNTSFLLNAEIGYRRVRNKGFKIELLLGAGTLRTFVNGDTYKVYNDGSVERIRYAGQWGFAPSLSLGVGKDFGFVGNSSMGFHIKPVMYVQMPYNLTVLPHFILEAGIIVRLPKS